ncbi:MAG: ATP-dependent helicase, partial [Planctomycetota bacterium]
MNLDPKQRAAALYDGGPLVVLAGPGSGKTSVITERIARLIRAGADPRSILCLTFTRRAAAEMASRVDLRVPESAREQGRSPVIATFHSVALRILRAEANEVEHLPQRFSIYDGAAEARAIRAALEESGLSAKSHPVPVVLSRIHARRCARRPESVPLGPYGDVLARYRTRLERAGALDFLGLLETAGRLLQTEPELRARWASRFRHVLVDEAQDTNHLQLKMLEGLLNPETDIALVGDPDQSIYGWRGPTPEVLKRFLDARPGTEVIRLERNYRSSANILEAADALIAPQQTLNKRLIATRESGEPLLSVCLEDDYREARALGTILQNLREDGHPLDDIAVLVRAHSQLRIIESQLARWKVPFHVVGSREFVERREILDLTAYLRLIDNPRDEDAFWRAIQAPRRGVGPVSAKRLQRIVGEANADVFWREQTTLVDAISSRRVTSGFQGRTRAGMESFAELMESLAKLSACPAPEALRRIVEALEPVDWLDSRPGGEGQGDRRAS